MINFNAQLLWDDVRSVASVLVVLGLMFLPIYLCVYYDILNANQIGSIPPDNYCGNDQMCLAGGRQVGEVLIGGLITFLCIVIPMTACAAYERYFTKKSD